MTEKYKLYVGPDADTTRCQCAYFSIEIDSKIDEEQKNKKIKAFLRKWAGNENMTHSLEKVN